MIRSYSSAVRPSSRARSRVAFGSALGNRSAPQEAAVLDQAVEERLEQREPVGTAHRALGGALRMGHEAEDVTVIVDDAGDVVERPVRVRRAGVPAVGVRIAEDDLAALAERGQRGGIGVIL